MLEINSFYCHFRLGLDIIDTYPLFWGDKNKYVLKPLLENLKSAGSNSLNMYGAPCLYHCKQSSIVCIRLRISYIVYAQIIVIFYV